MGLSTFTWCPRAFAASSILRVDGIFRERLRRTIFIGPRHMAKYRNGFQCGLPPSASMRFLALAAVVLLASCQTYDFERVTPLFVAQTTDTTVIASRRLKPNVMLLVDNSGSMSQPTDASDPDCMVTNAMGMRVLCGSAAACPSTCPTRISELKSAMGAFLQTSGGLARLGLTVFPTPGTGNNGLIGCDATSNITVQLPVPTVDDEGTGAALTGTAQQIDLQVQALTPTGGTPTAASLAFLGTYGGLAQNSDYRDDFVLLLTDGLPNCNGANPHNVCVSSVQAGACDCTTGGCTGTDAAHSTCSKGCLDRDATVESVKALRQAGIKTIVVGFGADLASGAGPLVLNAMAREGGFPRQCPHQTDAECGGSPGSCNTTTKQCSTSFFQAANGAELAEALRTISEGIDPPSCEFLLKAQPSDQRYLSVLIDDQNVAAGGATWAYDFAANRVTFLGPLCERIKASTPQHPVNLSFRIVERF